MKEKPAKLSYTEGTPWRASIENMQEKIAQFDSPRFKTAIDLQEPFRDLIDTKALIEQINSSSALQSDWIYPSSKFDFLRDLDSYIYKFEEDDIENLEIEEFELGAVKNNEPEKRIILLHEANRLENTIEQIYRDNNNLYRIKPREFEEVMAELLRHHGFTVELTKQTRDGGFDIIAVQNIADIPLRFLIECKRKDPNRPVGVEIIRAFSSVIHTQQANKGLIFTTSYFSSDAKKLHCEHYPYLLELRDRNHILEWVKGYINR